MSKPQQKRIKKNPDDHTSSQILQSKAWRKEGGEIRMQVFSKISRKQEIH
jgi:hypothetical protein